MIKEIWKDVAGFEGFYQVSNIGRVKSLERSVPQGKYGNTRTLQEKIMHQTDNGNGYLVVGLRRNGKRKNEYIHRLVADAFIPNPNNYGYVNHVDFNTQNNSACNLEWCTQKQNIAHSSARMRKQKKNCRQSATGEKYIMARNGRFRLHIHPIIDKTFGTLEDAVAAREVVMRGNEYFAR